MKKILWNVLTIMMIGIMSVGFTACGDNESDFDGTVSSSDIKGKWKCVKATQGWSTSGGVNNMLNKTITFSSSGYTLSAASRPFYSTGTYSVHSNQIWFYPSGMSAFMANISVNNGTMRIKGYDGDSFDYTFNRK